MLFRSGSEPTDNKEPEPTDDDETEPKDDDESEPTDDVSNEITDIQSLSVYANNGFIYAASDKLIIKEIKIYNLQGTEVYHSKVNDISHKTTKNFMPGVYIIQVKTDYGVISKKVITDDR